MLRLVLLLLLFIYVARVFWRIFDSFMEGVSGQPRRHSGDVPQRGVQMVRDPVCGTFVLPERAVSLTDGRTRVFFCSEACRDKYRARTA
jgi:YHS domain-containing protein